MPNGSERYYDQRARVNSNISTDIDNIPGDKQINGLKRPRKPDPALLNIFSSILFTNASANPKEFFSRRKTARVEQARRDKDLQRAVVMNSSRKKSKKHALNSSSDYSLNEDETNFIAAEENDNEENSLADENQQNDLYAYQECALDIFFEMVQENSVLRGPPPTRFREREKLLRHRVEVKRADGKDYQFLKTLAASKTSEVLKRTLLGSISADQNEAVVKNSEALKSSKGAEERNIEKLVAAFGTTTENKCCNAVGSDSLEAPVDLLAANYHHCQLDAFIGTLYRFNQKIYPTLPMRDMLFQIGRLGKTGGARVVEMEDHMRNQRRRRLEEDKLETARKKREEEKSFKRCEEELKNEIRKEEQLVADSNEIESKVNLLDGGYCDRDIFKNEVQRNDIETPKK